MWNKLKTLCAEKIRPVFFVPRELTAKSSRLFFLDGFRSVALVFMVASHGLKSWIRPDLMNAYIVNLNKIPAPIFFFLVGASYILSRNARLRKGLSREQVLFSYVRRSLVLFALALVYKIMDILFGTPFEYIRWWEVDVLNIIAISLFLTALFDYLVHRSTQSRRGYLAVALLGVALAPLMFRMHFPPGFPNLVRLYLQGTQAEYAWFTLLPYSGYTFFGAWMVQSFVEGYLEKPFLNLQNVGLLLLACMGAGQGLAYISDNTLIDDCALSLFYYSRAFLLLAAGVYAAFHFQRLIGFGPFLIVGTYTMIGYWVHAKIVYLYYKPFLGNQDWAGSFGLLFKTYLITFAVVFAWSEIKKRVKAWKKKAAPCPASSFLKP